MLRPEVDKVINNYGNMMTHVVQRYVNMITYGAA